MITEHFKKQVEAGTGIFFYGLEAGSGAPENITISIRSHKDTLDNFPTNLEFVRMLSEATPLFKEIANV
jgi:hypothetical protein